MKKGSSPVSSPEQLKLTEGEKQTPAIDVNKRLNTAMNAQNGNLFTALYNGDKRATAAPQRLYNWSGACKKRLYEFWNGCRQMSRT